MAKDSIFVGAVNDSDFKNKGTSPTNGTANDGGMAGYQKRTKSPRAQQEVLTVTGNRLPRPSKK